VPESEFIDNEGDAGWGERARSARRALRAGPRFLCSYARSAAHAFS
jgi:hypothetical protein